MLHDSTGISLLKGGAVLQCSVLKHANLCRLVSLYLIQHRCKTVLVNSFVQAIHYYFPRQRDVKLNIQKQTFQITLLRKSPTLLCCKLFKIQQNHVMYCMSQCWVENLDTFSPLFGVQYVEFPKQMPKCKPKIQLSFVCILRTSI